MRVKINKTAAKTTSKEEDGPHELTNITVKEVSVVDRAANKKRFLVTKKAGEQASASTEDETDLAALGKVSVTEDDLAVKLDKADKEAGKTDAQKALDAKDAVDKAALEAEKARLAKEAAPADTSSPAAGPGVVEPVDALKALDDLAQGVKKDEPLAVVVVTEQVTQSPTAEKVKAAILAGIDEIAAKVGEYRKAIAESSEKNTDQLSGRPYAVWEYGYYISRMLDSISNIGGADWEMLNATIGKELAEVGKAGNKAITATRVGTLKAVHEGLTHCLGTMDKVMKELTEETVAAPNAPVADSFAKAAPVMIVQDPALAAKVAELTTRAEKAEQTAEALRGVVKSQADALGNARAGVSSNTISGDHAEITKSNPDRDKVVVWDVDLAPPRRRFSR